MDERQEQEAVRAALRRAEDRLALALEAAGVALCEHGVPPERGLYHSPGWSAILGLTVDQLPPAEGYLDWFCGRLHPADQQRYRQAYQDVLAGRAPGCELELRLRHADGQWRWVRVVTRAAERDFQGRVTRVVTVMLDLTAQKRVEEECLRLLAQERAARADAERARQRYRDVVEGVGCVVFEADTRSRRFTFVNGWAERILGFPIERWYEQGFWIDHIVHPEDRAAVLRAFTPVAEAGGHNEIDFRARRTDGEEIWIQGITRRHSDGGGDPDLIRGILVDVTGRKRLELQERLLMAEIDHRSKNMLAAVQSMIQLTKPPGGTVDEYARTLIGRVRAMSRAHDLLSKERWEGARLHRLIREEFEALLGAGHDRVGVAGDDLLLRPRAAQTLSLALHELATNAAKYGALSAPGGRVEVTSTIRTGADAAPLLAIEWVEAGGPEVGAPAQRGFGSLILERSVPHDLGGQATLTFAPDGVRCRMELPLAGVSKHVEP